MAKKAKALEVPDTPDASPPKAKPETIVWLNRIAALLTLAPGHEGAAERIRIYADKVEADIGVRPVTSIDVQRVLADIRGL